MYPSLPAGATAEEQLTETQRALAMLISNLPGMVYRAANDGEWTLQYASEGCERLTGYTPEHFMRQKVSFGTQVMHEDDRRRANQSVAVAVKLRERFELTYRIRTLDGAVKWVREYGQGVFDDSGRLVALEGVITDITEFVDTQRTLKDTVMNLAVRVKELRCLHELARLAHREDLTIPEILQNALDLIPPAMQDPHNMAARILFEDITVETDGFRQTDIGISAPLDVAYSVSGLVEVCYVGSRDLAHSPFFPEEHALIDAVASTLGQILEKRNAYDALAALTAQVAEANEQLQRRSEQLSATNREMAAKARELTRSNKELEQFAYVASHDLQEPLRMVTSFMQLLAMEYRGKLDPQADEYIEYAVDGATRMGNLIHDLLTFSRIGAKGADMAPVRLKSVFDDAVLNLTVAIEESEAVITHDDLPVVVGDESQLVLLFQNLLANGIKFAKEGPPRIHIGVERIDSEWQIAVKDNGIGFDAEFSERIFGVFQRLHDRSEYAGTGIGLAICKKTVERHGGRIWAESAPDEGATFYFTLPDEVS